MTDDRYSVSKFTRITALLKQLPTNLAVKGNRYTLSIYTGLLTGEHVVHYTSATDQIQTSDKSLEKALAEMVKIVNEIKPKRIKKTKKK